MNDWGAVYCSSHWGIDPRITARSIFNESLPDCFQISEFVQLKALADSEGATFEARQCAIDFALELSQVVILITAEEQFVQNAIARATSDGGEAGEVILTESEIIDLLPVNYASASFLYIPFARKAGVSYSLIGPDLTIDRNSAATEVNRQLLLGQVSDNVPRIEFDANGPKGHLIQGQLTNLFRDAQCRGGVSSMDYATANPQLNTWGIGLSSMAVLVANINSRFVDYSAGAALVEGETYTIGAFVKRTDGLEPVASITNNPDADYAFVLAVAANGAYLSQHIGNGVYFQQATFNAGNSSQWTGVRKRDNQSPVDIEVSGIMLVEGDVTLNPSDFIDTNGAAASRLEERVTELSYTPSLQWTLFVNCSDYQDGGISGDDQFRFRNANGNLLFHLWGLSQGFTLRSFFGDTSGNYYTNTTPERTPSVVIRYDGAEINIFYSGEKVSDYGGRSITESQWGNLATFQIPRTDNTFNLKRMGVLPYAATDEQCQTLSAL